VLSLYVLRNDIQAERWAHAAFAAANALIVAPAIVALIGLRASVSDVWRGFVRMLYAKPRAPKPSDVAPQLDPVADWSTVLYYGSTDQPRPWAELPASEQPAPEQPAPDPSVAPMASAQVDVA
jgi:hypothetical protein